MVTVAVLNVSSCETASLVNSYMLHPVKRFCMYSVFPFISLVPVELGNRNRSGQE